MQQVCKQCTTTFEITDDDLVFLEKVSPEFNGKKESIPPPTHCPECRQRRRWAMQNQRNLYKRTSDVTGKEIVSCYSPEKKFTVYEREKWLEVDNTDMGRDFDFSRPFFDQFSELFQQTIKSNVLQSGEIINSEYTHFCGWLKNCYLLFDVGKNEDCMYGNFMGYCKSCVDCMDMQVNELCYDAVDHNDCYNVFHSTFCKNCNFCAYIEDCIGCKNCIGCMNLRNKEYCIFNEQKTKEEFDRTWKELFNGSYETHVAMRKRWQEFRLTVPHRALQNINVSNSTGEYLVDCENAFDSYKCTGSKDIRYCQYAVIKVNDCYDISAFGENIEFCYECASSGGLLNKLGISNCCFNAYAYYGGYGIFYGIHCMDNCKNCFGCCDIRAKQYCILNKQYTKEQYEELVPKIISHMRETGEWGEFFPMSLSAFSYNETLAQDYFPLTKEEAGQKGIRWRDKDPKEYVPSGITLPDNVRDAPADLSQHILACTQCTKNYRVITQELAFYQTHSLPVPRHCPECRYQYRLTRRNPQTLWDRSCANCSKAIKTSYAPDRPETIYCEECYIATVY